MQGAQNSCNPVFIEVGLRLGVEKFCDYFRNFGLMEKTGIDLPGEASTIMHKEENIGEVELATMAFGQSFQITPIRLAATVSALVNGGKMVTPHVATDVLDEEGNVVKHLKFPEKEGVLSEETSRTVREILESVVSEGSGKNAYLEGYSIGGKTATSQTLPRSANRYISSFLGFTPAEHRRCWGFALSATAGRLLRRNDLRAGDPRYLFQCTSVSRYWTQFLGNLRIVSFAALI